MFCFLQVFSVFFSSVLLSLAIPNEIFKTGCPVFALFALVPLYIAISRTESYRQAFFLSFLHGGLVHLFSSFWLKNFQGMALFTLGASLLGTAFIEGILGWFLYFPFSKKNRNLPGLFTLIRVFWFPAVYVIYEWCKSTGFLGYPWGTLSMAAFSWPVMMQIADITGQYGVSFIFALFSSVTAQGIILIQERNKIINLKECVFSYMLASKTFFILLGLTLVYGVFQYTRPRFPVKQVNTVMVQQNMDTYRTNELDAIKISQLLTDEGIKEFSSKKQKTDLVVWSEGVLNRRWPDSHGYYLTHPEEKPLLKYIKEKKIPFIIGGALILNWEKHKYSNAALLFDKNGEYAGAYSKIHLVPFAEAIPFVDYEPVRNFIKKIAGFSYGWTAGTKNTVFEIPLSTPKNASINEIISLEKKPAEKNTVLVAAPICFDDAFGHVFRGLFSAGTELFMNITNDSWSATQSAEYQHLAVAAYRAIEFRTTLARCTNSGVTTVISPSGKEIVSLPLFEQSHLSVSVPVYERQVTVASQFGDWLPVTFIVLATLFLIFCKKNDEFYCQSRFSVL